MLSNRTMKTNVERAVKELMNDYTIREFRMVTNDLVTIKMEWGLNDAKILVRSGSARTSVFQDLGTIYSNGTFKMKNSISLNDKLLISKIKSILIKKGMVDLG